MHIICRIYVWKTMSLMWFLFAMIWFNGQYYAKLNTWCSKPCLWLICAGRIWRQFSLYLLLFSKHFKAYCSILNHFFGHPPERPEHLKLRFQNNNNAEEPLLWNFVQWTAPFWHATHSKHWWSFFPLQSKKCPVVEMNFNASLVVFSGVEIAKGKPVREWRPSKNEGAIAP